MDLLTPGIGLIFWSTLIFIFLLIVLKKYAWKPILNAVKSREERIKGALESAEEVREEMARLIRQTMRQIKLSKQPE
jgi:F-type H+-transporting ATPase subunit b